MASYLQTGELIPQPSVEERVRIARRHLELSVGVKGERVGVLELRRHLNAYFKGFRDFKDIRIRLVTEPSVEGLHAIFDEILETYRDYDSTGIIPTDPWGASATR